MKLPRRKSKRARGAAKVADGAKTAGRAAGRSGKRLAKVTGRKASGKRTSLLVGVPVVAAGSVASFLAARKMRRGAKQTVEG